MKNVIMAVLIMIFSAIGLVACSSGSGVTKADVGTVAGGVAGGFAGNAITGGSTLGTIGGALGGAFIGNRVGQSMSH